MLLFTYLLAIPLVSATFINTPKPVCGTKTATCTKVTTIRGGTPVTSTCSQYGNCYSTITKTAPGCNTAWVTTYTTFTRTPVVTITAPPTRTATCTKWVNKSVCVNKWKKDDIPNDMTNAERLKLGLPLRSLAEERRWFLNPPPGPSCTPTTITNTDWITKTIPPTVTTTSTICRFTTVKVIPNTSTLTRTTTGCKTITGPPVTITNPCRTVATTTVTSTRTVPCRC